MTLLELLSARGNLELTLQGSAGGDKVAVKVSRGGESLVMVFEDVAFASGGALTLVHSSE